MTLRPICSPQVKFADSTGLQVDDCDPCWGDAPATTGLAP
jgi:hypothetical protein